MSFTRSHARLSLALAATLFVPTAFVAHAQTSFGTLTGTVADPNGAVVPDAKVTIRNADTGLSRTLISDTAGNYNAPSLPPGRYIVSVERDGFSKQVGNPLTLAADQVARVDFALAIGGVDQVITVDTTVAQLQTDSPGVGTTIDSKKIVDLPLNGRNFVQLTQLIPGVNPGTVSSIAARRGRGSIGQSDANGGLTATQINGQRDTQNRYFIEGSEAMDYDANTYSFSPSVDAIGEFKVETSSSTAENGGALGGFINVILKAGTNNYHGTLWEFNRNNYLTQSHDFVSVTNPNPTAPRLNRNQFGGNVGGPVIIPHLYNGRNRTFFFVNEEEGRNLTAASPSFLQVPSLAAQNGDLSALTGRVLAATGTGTVNAIIDPLTGQPFANKQIPVNRISASALRLLSFAQPNGAFAANANYQTATPKALSSQRDIITRLDHQLTQKDQLNGHFIYDNTYAAGTPLFGNDQSNNNAHTYNVAVSEVHTFNSATVNTATYGYQRFTEEQVFGTTGNATYNISNPIGIPFASTDPRFYGPPSVSISGTDGIFRLFQLQNVIGPRNRANSAHTLSDVLSRQLGRHFVSVGTQITLRNDTFDQIRDPRGTFAFNGQWTGSALADFLLGYMQSSSINPTHTYTNLRTPWQGYYVQDSWHAHEGLTISLGMRWDHMPPWVQNDNKFAAIATGNDGIATSTLLTPQSSPNGRGLIPSHYYDFAPRLGVAWQPFGNGKTVVRGGYGWYFTTDLANQAFTWAEGAQAQSGAALSTSNSARLGVATNPTLTWANPFPNVTLTNATTYPFATAVDPNLQDAYTQQWNVTVQQQLPAKLLFDIGYVGAKSTHNYAYYPDVNMPVPVDPSTPGLASLASRRPNQTFTSGGNARAITGDLSNSSSTYNSLQTKLERRVGNGLTVLAAYTWSHSLSGPADIGGYVGGGSFNPTGLNVRNPRGDRSASIFDLRNRFVGTVLWDVPFFKSSHGLKKTLLDGFQVSTIVVAQSGPAATVFNSADTTGTGLASRPDLIPGLNPNLPTAGRSKAQWFNTAAFARAAAGTFGNEPRVGAITLPGILNDDSSFVKGFKLGEQRNLQVRADIFNLFLHYNPNPNAVGTSLNNTSTFGKLGGGTSDVVSRIVQLSAKLYF